MGLEFITRTPTLGEHLQGQLEKLAEALQMTTDDAELTLAEVVLMRSHTTQRLEEIANINDATEEVRISSLQ